MIEGLVKDGVTLLLTTQYLEEADQLADDIVVVDQGKVIARGSSDHLKQQVGGERIEIVVAEADISGAREVMDRVTGTTVLLDAGLRRLSAPVQNGSTALMNVIREFDAKGIHPLDIAMKRPSLDDVFLSLTGHAAEEISEDAAAGAKSKRGKK